jgi:hypothetical protein
MEDEPEPQPEPKTHYILDIRDVVGNSACWWRPDGKGYTCDLGDAGLYPESYFKGLRPTDVPVPRELAERLVQRHVHIDHLRQNMKLPYRDGSTDESRAQAAEERARNQEPRLQRALGVDPFVGDYGSTGDRKLRDKIVTAKREHRCHGGRFFDCTGRIAVGERHRVMVEVSDGETTQYRWCQRCTLAMLEEP